MWKRTLGADENIASGGRVMKILLVRTIAIEENLGTATYNNQGIGLATALSELGHECGLVYFAKKGNHRTETMLSDGYKLTVYHIERKNLVWNALYNKELFDICKEYDVIQTSECDQICSWQIYKRFPEKTVIYHGPYRSKYTKKYNIRSRFFDLVFTWRNGFRDARVITKSKLAEDYLRAKGFRNIVTLGVGLNPYMLNREIEHVPEKLEKVIHEKGKQKYLLYVGAISQRKNTMFLLRVLKTLVKNMGYDEYRLLIIGDKAYKEKWYFNHCFSYIDEQSLQDNVIYLGKIEQKYLRLLYPLCDIYLLATQYDIFGMVYLEAMYFGVTILTTSCGGSSLLIQEGVTGYILDSQNADEWAEKAEEIIENEEKNKLMHDNAQKLIRDNYLWAKLVPRFLEVYRGLLTDG